MASMEPFNRLVRLAARAFYDNISLKGDNQPKTSRGDNRGMAVVVLDALTRRQWVREEDLAKALKLHSKQLRRILRFFEEEKLVTRDHRKESAKGAKMHNTAAAAAGDSQPVTKEGEEKVKMHTHSYCCLDYAQICDVVRYRIHRMKKKLKDELDSRNTIQHYICPSCNKRYSAFDALQLVSYTDEYFHCENCNGELVAESDKLASEEMGDGDDNVRKRRREKLKDMQQELKHGKEPNIALLQMVTLVQLIHLGTHKGSMFEVEIGVKEEGAESGLKDDQSIQEEYIKAYYEALRKKQEEEEAKRRMQQEGEAFVSDSQSERQVGKKHKREDEDEGIEWEEQQPTGNATETYKLADLNAEAQESGDDEDDLVWEDGYTLWGTSSLGDFVN
ncbi:hypothetical protein HU200_000413 [Digitaria exilis]|uniref:HTH TFE/IIEalpha-type domain-containing protein n=1 Tax=Digitaria exilis TaxID=1010633 RepID=A0A835KYG9_9POAL|nr:hypothetical protein HU200_000413 [Digitaria exilis]